VSCMLIHIRRLIFSCFHLLQWLILKWTKPLHTSLLLGTVMDLTRGEPELVAENALLRQQLIILRRQIKRPSYPRTDRLLLILRARAVRVWRQALVIVQPETLLRWHRQGFRLFWKQKSKPKSTQAKVTAETIALIKQMAKHNRRLRSRTDPGANCSSWVFASANARFRSTCGMCARLDQEARTGGPSSAIMRGRSGPVIFSKSPTSSFARFLPSSSLNCDRGRSSMSV
jgi:hypothetical protein